MYKHITCQQYVTPIPITSVEKDIKLQSYCFVLSTDLHRIRNRPPGCRHITPLPVISDAECLLAFHVISLVTYHAWTRAIALQKYRRGWGPVFE